MCVYRGCMSFLFRLFFVLPGRRRCTGGCAYTSLLWGDRCFVGGCSCERINYRIVSIFRIYFSFVLVC